MQQTSSGPRRRGARLWHVLPAVLAVALIVRFGLGALPGPPPHAAEDRQDEESTEPSGREVQSVSEVDPGTQTAVEIVPFDVQGEVPGPLLTRILQRYLPESTADHADALRDTLPPSEDPRMIVIIPEDTKPRF